MPTYFSSLTFYRINAKFLFIVWFFFGGSTETSAKNLFQEKKSSLDSNLLIENSISLSSEKKTNQIPLRWLIKFTH